MDNKVVGLVDDEEVFHQLFKMHARLMDDSLKVLSFYNGEEIYSYLSDSPEMVPEILFLDINMPVCNAWGFLEKYSAIYPDVSEIDIYILSSSIDPEDKDRAMNYSVVKEFVSKPITNEFLSRALKPLADS